MIYAIRSWVDRDECSILEGPTLNIEETYDKWVIKKIGPDKKNKTQAEFVMRRLMVRKLSFCEFMIYLCNNHGFKPVQFEEIEL